MQKFKQQGKSYSNEEIFRMIEGKQTLPFYEAQEGLLPVSECFESIQGEGKYMGVPAVFLRLQGCNLLCSAWPCDTIPVWKEGKYFAFDEMFNDWQTKGYFDKFRNGTHLILTGGEPMARQSEVASFFNYIVRQQPRFYPFIEVETNTTYKPEVLFDDWIRHYTCSPKLSNSGMTKERRYRPEVLKTFARNPKAIFKFVIDSQQDLRELNEDFIEPFKIKPNKIWLMPEATSDEELKEKSKWVVEICKEHSFNFSSRIHVQIWNALTGV